ncbi:hypothetical protein [Neorhizobium sp. AL 9.2.2]|uniref:hypothetical protein n=1 Tax=Neorhizobium sp. AL 9.2.2 TaxID=2712894 RepID=UPI0015746291|nr:hypothetical protein [Neorhizobium sp. AL 9.2.2]NSY16308.1 hypothetical protein [Neorhizobium sp. AL 9.2.2]
MGDAHRAQCAGLRGVLGEISCRYRLNDVGDLSGVNTRTAISDFLTAAWLAKPQSIAMAAGQLHRFVNEIEVDDMVIKYNPSAAYTSLERWLILIATTPP